MDTRKTTPNFRYPEKWAVLIGGGENHRMGLFDMIMIKDNHIDFCGSVTAALTKTKKYLENQNLEIPVIIEVRNKKEIEACLNFKWIHRILLDNMNPVKLSEGLKIIKGKIATEASGNITSQNIVSIAETGVDYVSLGAITHSAKNIDLVKSERSNSNHSNNVFAVLTETGIRIRILHLFSAKSLKTSSSNCIRKTLLLE